MKTHIPITVLLAACLSLSSHASLYTGSDGGDWFTGTNWDNGVPTTVENANVDGPGGPIVGASGGAANNLYMGGSTPSSTVTIPSGGALTTTQDVRVGLGSTVGTANVIVDGGTLACGRDIYIAQTNAGGSVFTLNSGSVSAASHLRLGYNEAGSLEISGGTFAITGRLDFHRGTFSILDDDATISFNNSFRFGVDGPSTLEYVLTTSGTTSPVSVTSMNATFGNESIRIDASAVADPGTITSLVLLHTTGSLFYQAQVDTLNASLDLVGLSGFSLALANGNADIVLVPAVPADVYYTGPDGGDWATGANWNLARTPSSIDKARVTTPGPVITTTEIVADLWMAGGATPTTVTIPTGGSLTTNQDTRVGVGGSGTNILTISGGSLTAGRDIYISQTNNAGSKLTLDSGTIELGGQFRVGYQAIGTLEISGGSIQTTSASSRLDFHQGTIRILDDDATLEIDDGFRFGIDGPATLEYVLTSGGTTSPISMGSLNATFGNETLRIDGSSVVAPQAITSLVLFQSTGAAFYQAQVDTLNASLELVGLSGFSLALANGNMDIALVPDAPTAITITGSLVNASNEFVIDFVGAPSSNYEVKKSTSLSGFVSLTVPLIETTDASGIGQAIVPASEMSGAKQFFLLEDAP